MLGISPRRLALVASALLVCAAPVSADNDKLKIAFEKYKLANGLEVILHQDHRLPLVAVSVWYHVGGFHEAKGRSGFAHLFEHMMFQGSAHVGDDKHFAILKQLGASFVNGTTSFDRTNYIETVPASQLESALWLESDRMGFLLNAVTLKKLDNQRAVVKNERRQGLETQPYGFAREKMWQAMFPQPHPYHGRVIGSMADLNAATVADVGDFFRTWYSPANATLTLAGDFKKPAARALIKKYFGSLASKPRPAAPVVKPVALTKQVALRHDEKVATLAQVTVGWHTPAFFAEGDAVADILASALASGKASRLQRRLVRELQIAQSVSAYQASMGAQSVFMISATARPGVAPDKLLTQIDAVLEQVREEGVKQAEVSRALNRFETGFFSGLQRLGGFGGKAERLQRYNHFTGDPGYLLQDLGRYRKVTPARVKQFAIKYLPRDRRVVMTAVPLAKGASKKGGK